MIRDILKIMLILFIVCFVFPSFIRLAGNFFEYLVFGEMTKTEFMQRFRQFSYGPTVDFYKTLFYKLTH
ncbi:MAG: hypothetical protein NC898_02010 [Candidatus Omnitrophica bacterium]|nr:hypothetical protein [Candidatus Omnitrophota bacterium]MCM8793227.1 hypothetical protein [Candidatus Omnitrophota bacterium]